MQVLHIAWDAATVTQKNTKAMFDQLTTKQARLLHQEKGIREEKSRPTVDIFYGWWRSHCPTE